MATTQPAGARLGIAKEARNNLMTLALDQLFNGSNFFSSLFFARELARELRVVCIYI